jgi:hypothetical protein
VLATADVRVEDVIVLAVGTITLLELLETLDVSLYISNLFPAPQYSKAFPGQVKLQSA